MLTALSIRDIVLIRALDLTFGAGLTVLTGETGAGKSILLDALALALGARADARLVRAGADKGRVTAHFTLPLSHPAHNWLGKQDLEAEEPGMLLIRRSVTADGRSRAHINDQPVSVGMLRDLGELLVEIHGQHDERGLLNPRGHRRLLDIYADHAPLLDAVYTTHKVYGQAALAYDEQRQALQAAQAEEAGLRATVTELDALAPQEEEETDLAGERADLMQGEAAVRDLADFRATLSGEDGAEMILGAVLRRITRLDAGLQERISGFGQALERAAAELEEASRHLTELEEALAHDPARLEAVEARLFDLRGMARKHAVPVSALAALAEQMRSKLAALETGAADLEQAEALKAQAWANFHEACENLSASRFSAAKALETAVAEELPDLKLGAARFQVHLQALPETEWGEAGAQRVGFEVATNPGAAFGPLIKIASGGELARFILALKVALAGQSGVSSMIFDEVDRGIGGATADAVGARLARLAIDAQLLVVTHSPQVAACGDTHLRISKADGADGVETFVEELDAHARREEIARMLSGATVTDAARTAADSLMARP